MGLWEHREYWKRSNTEREGRKFRRGRGCWSVGDMGARGALVGEDTVERVLMGRGYWREGHNYWRGADMGGHEKMILGGGGDICGEGNAGGDWMYVLGYVK